MKRNFIIKKIRALDITQVISVWKDQTVFLRFQPFVLVNSNDFLPPGCFSLRSEGLVLPKKRRGEKYVVRYTILMEKTL